MPKNIVFSLADGKGKGKGGGEGIMRKLGGGGRGGGGLRAVSLRVGDFTLRSRV